VNYTSYETRTIAETMAKINSEYFIPAIQRPYVWEVDQIERLFDSIMKEYPISTFLLWKPPVENRATWHTYQFAQHFKYGDLHSEDADLSSSQDMHLVLDGQQRLTSLFIGLRGSYRVRPKYKRKNQENSYTRQLLYLNLVKNAETSAEEDEVEGVTYGFSFRDPAKIRQSATEYWMPVSRVLDLEGLDQLEDATEGLVDAMDVLGASLDSKRSAKRNLKRLHAVIWEQRTISACIVKQSSYDKVLDIFVRANDGGTKLSKSDLLMSLVTLNWQHFDARHDIVQFLSELNNELLTTNSFDRDFILRASLLFCGHAYVFKVDSFTKENLAHIEENWTTIKRSLRKTVKLVNSFGLSNYKGNLSSSNSILPVAFYVFSLLQRHRNDEQVDTILQRNRTIIRRWLCAAQFSGVFGGAADSTVVRAVRAVKEGVEHSDSYPATTISEEMIHRRKTAMFDEDRIGEFLELTSHDRNYRVYLQMLYEQNDWESDDRSREFLFTIDEAKQTVQDIEERLVVGQDVPTIANMLLLKPYEAEELKTLGAVEWLITRTEAERCFHFLPSPSTMDCTRFTVFLEARQDVIRACLRNLFGATPDRETVSQNQQPPATGEQNSAVSA
jgi:uncharacterized protein with ParB-like and HNH nuclease domain